MTFKNPVANETSIRTGGISRRIIGVVTKPEGGRRYFGHSIHPVPTKSFRLKWEAASYLHAVHDNHTA